MITIEIEYIKKYRGGYHPDYKGKPCLQVHISRGNKWKNYGFILKAEENVEFFSQKVMLDEDLEGLNGLKLMEKKERLTKRLT